MDKRYCDIVIVSLSVLAVFLISFVFADWFNKTMLRHQLLQLPFFLILGIFLARYFLNGVRWPTYLRISGLMLVMGSLIFWMIPLSIDLAVIKPGINRLMHLNVLGAGVVTFLSLNRAILSITTVFYSMLTAMLIGTGMILINFDILLCSAFDIKQQQDTGSYLVGIGLACLILTYLQFFRRLSVQ